VMRPIWSDLEHTRDATRLWQRGQRRFISNVMGPHFEHLCRYWTRYVAAPELLGGDPHRVGAGTVNDPANRTRHELDVVAFGLDEDDRSALLLIGEAKWGEPMGTGHLDRLRRIRGLLVAQNREGAATAKLACFGGSGFSAELREQAADDPGVLLVEPTDLYR
jgi:uncharacterized protein